jgi:hypothetical protein
MQRNKIRLFGFCLGLALLLATMGAWGVARVQAAAEPAEGWQGELSIGEVGARLGPSLPWLLGMDAPRTYLLLVQNNHELRPTGGFIAAVGRVSVDKGRLTELDFTDSYQFYSEKSTYPPAPLPMREHMAIELLVMRDANWSPDFPTSAQMARAFYAQETGIQADGVFTIDLNAVKLLVGALGELTVPGADEPITGENIEEQVIQFWEQPIGADSAIGDNWDMEWFNRRKDFMPAIAKAALERVQSGADYGALLAAAQMAMDARAIQGWVNNPQVQSVLHEARWDGGLQPASGADFLAVVDTNMGYNKVDAAIQRALTYSVTWPEAASADSRGLATVTITYSHPITTPDPGCDPSPRYGTTYADMIARCYFDYVRVYAPAGSELVTAKGMTGETITSRRGESGTQEFAGFFVLPPAGEQQVSFTYHLPAGMTAENYRLILQRQSGTQPLPVQINVGGVTHAATVGEGWLDWALP